MHNRILIQQRCGSAAAPSGENRLEKLPTEIFEMVLKGPLGDSYEEIFNDVVKSACSRTERPRTLGGNRYVYKSSLALKWIYELMRTNGHMGATAQAWWSGNEWICTRPWEMLSFGTAVTHRCLPPVRRLRLRVPCLLETPDIAEWVRVMTADQAGKTPLHRAFPFLEELVVEFVATGPTEWTFLDEEVPDIDRFDPLLRLTRSVGVSRFALLGFKDPAIAEYFANRISAGRSPRPSGMRASLDADGRPHEQIEFCMPVASVLEHLEEREVQLREYLEHAVDVYRGQQQDLAAKAADAAPRPAKSPAPRARPQSPKVLRLVQVRETTAAHNRMAVRGRGAVKPLPSLFGVETIDATAVVAQSYYDFVNERESVAPAEADW